MDNKDNKRGFSGLSDLASEIEEEVKPKIPTPTSPQTAPMSEEASAAANENESTQTDFPESKPPISAPAAADENESVQTDFSESNTPISAPAADQAPSSTSGGASPAKWFWGIVGAGIFIVLINSGQNDNRSSNGHRTYSPSSSAPSTYTAPRRTSTAELNRQPSGTVEQKETEINTKQELVGCCDYSGELHNRKEDMNIGPTTKKVVEKGLDTNVVKDIQRLLVELGYNPGPIDGKYGAKTRAAIESFQARTGLSIDGKVTAKLRETLAHTEHTQDMEKYLILAEESCKWIKDSNRGLGAFEACVSGKLDFLKNQHNERISAKEAGKNDKVSQNKQPSKLDKRNVTTSGESDANLVRMQHQNHVDARTNSVKVYAAEEACSWHKAFKDYVGFKRCVDMKLSESAQQP